MSPTATTTYYGRFEDGSPCSSNTVCAQVTVTVNQRSADPTSASATSSTICNGQSTTLNLTGGGGGSGAVIHWYTVSCGGISVGTGNALSVSPTATTTYYGRYEDGSPCIYNSPCAQVTVTVSSVPVVTNANTETICSGSATNISLNASIPSNFSWTIGTIIRSVNGASAGSGSTINQTLTVSHIFGGSVQYIVTPTSITGSCVGSQFTITVTVNPAPTINIASQVNVLCYGSSTGSATTSSSGGTSPFTYLWSNGQTTSGATGLAAGPYTVTLTDSKGCTAVASGTITQPASALSTAISNLINVQCNGQSTGSVTVTGNGGVPPYTYALGAGLYQAGGTFNSLAAGSYTVHVKDNNNCIANQAVTISQTNPLIATATSNSVVCEGSALNLTGSATGGTGPYQYHWLGPNSFSSSIYNPSIINATRNATGSYELTVTDANNCTATTTVQAIVNPVPNVSITPTMATGFVKKATGQQVFYQFTITNTGNVADIFDLTSINVPDAGFYDMTARFLTTGGVPITFTPSIPAGGTYTFQVELTVGGNAAKVLNHTMITATSRLCSSSHVSADIYTYEYNGNNPPDPNNAQLEIYKESSVASATVGVPYTYTIKLYNNGSVDAPNVIITDPVPASLTITNPAGRGCKREYYYLGYRYRNKTWGFTKLH